MADITPEVAQAVAQTINSAITKSAAYLGAGICVGLGGIGSAVGEGYIGGKTVEGISRRPEEYPQLFKTMLISQAVCETCAIYALVIALILIFMRN